MNSITVYRPLDKIRTKCTSANLNTTSLKVLNLLLDSKSNLVACLKPAR
jgi:hypothetical protein